MKWFPIRYTWTTRGKQHHGNSVERGMNLADAQARFARDNPHVDVVGRASPRAVPVNITYAQETIAPVTITQAAP